MRRGEMQAEQKRLPCLGIALDCLDGPIAEQVRSFRLGCLAPSKFTEPHQPVSLSETI
jgi:hypothetical protein